MKKLLCILSIIYLIPYLASAKPMNVADKSKYKEWFDI